MSDFIEHLAMDGHGLYVWLSYGLALVIVFLNLAMPMLGFKRTKARVKNMLRREGKLK